MARWATAIFTVLCISCDVFPVVLCIYQISYVLPAEKAAQEAAPGCFFLSSGEPQSLQGASAQEVQVSHRKGDCYHLTKYAGGNLWNSESCKKVGPGCTCCYPPISPLLPLLWIPQSSNNKRRDHETSTQKMFWSGSNFAWNQRIK